MSNEQQGQVPADGEVKAWLIRADNGMAIKCVMSEQERDALLFRGESSQFPEWTATPLVEAATPQAPKPVVDEWQYRPYRTLTGELIPVEQRGSWSRDTHDAHRTPSESPAWEFRALYAHPPTIGQQAVDDAMVERALDAQLPGGGRVRDFGWPRYALIAALIAALAAHGKGG